MSQGNASSRSLGVPWGSPTVLVIFASTLVAIMGVSLVSPALPTIQDVWGITEGEASLLISAYTLPGIVLTPVIGLLADRIGRKRVLVPSLLLFGLAGSAIPLVGGFGTILGLRLLQGVAGSAIASLTVTLIGDLFSGETRDTLIGLNAAILAVGAAGYPVLGGALAAISWAAPFVGFVLGVLVALLGASVLEEPALEGGESGLSYFLDAARAVPARTVFSLYVAIFGIFVVLYGAQLTAVPFILDNQYRLSPGVIGVLLALPAVTMGITSSQAGRLLRHLSSVQLVPLGFVAYGIGLVGAGLAESVPVIAASLLLFGLGQGLSEPITDTALNAITPDEFRGGVMSVRTSVLQAGTTVGPPLFIGLATTIGYLDVLVGVGVAAFGLGSVAFVLIGRHQRRIDGRPS